MASIVGSEGYGQDEKRMGSSGTAAEGDSHLNYRKQDSESTTLRSAADDEKGDVVHNLARALTQHSIKNADGEHVNPFLGSDDPLLDPNSGKFRSVWLARKCNWDGY